MRLDELVSFPLQELVIPFANLQSKKTGANVFIDRFHNHALNSRPCIEVSLSFSDGPQ